LIPVPVGVGKCGDSLADLKYQPGHVSLRFTFDKSEAYWKEREYQLPQKIPLYPCQPNIQTPLWPQLQPFSVNPILRFFFASLSLFFFPSTLAPHHERLALYVTIFNDERRILLSFSPPCPSLPYHD
jgi:hypothetical protein